MKKIIVLIITIFMINAAKGQLVNQWMYGDTVNCTRYEFLKTFDGGFLLTGNKYYTSNSSSDFRYILKTNSMGDTLWTKTLEVDSGLFGSCTQTYDSGFVFTGTSCNKFMILKVNKLGDSLWTKTYNLGYKSSNGITIIEAYDHSLIALGSKIDTFTQYYPGEPIGIRTDEFGNYLNYFEAGGGYGLANYIIQTKDSNFIVSHLDIYMGPPIPHFFKEDINGQFIWEGYNYPNSWGGGIVETNDNGFILSGQYNNYLYLMKTDSVDNIVWSKTDSSYYAFTSVCVALSTNDGGYLLVGEDTLVRLSIIKLNNQGNYQWSKSYAGYGTAKNAIVDKTNINGFAILGTTHNPTTDKDEMYFILTDSLGNTMFTPCSAQFNLVADTTPHNYIAINNATGTPPLHYIWSWGDGASDTIAYPSHTYSTAGYYNICLSITDANGCTNTYCDSSYLQKSINSMITINVIPHITLVIDTNKLLNQITIYPNPTKDNLTIETNTNTEQRLEIVNLFGQTIYTSYINKKTTINTSAFANGVYILKLSSDKETIIKKFVKE